MGCPPWSKHRPSCLNRPSRSDDAYSRRSRQRQVLPCCRREGDSAKVSNMLMANGPVGRDAKPPLSLQSPGLSSVTCTFCDHRHHGLSRVHSQVAWPSLSFWNECTNERMNGDVGGWHSSLCKGFANSKPGTVSCRRNEDRFAALLSTGKPGRLCMPLHWDPSGRMSTFP